MLLQGNTSQVRNVQQDIMKVEGNVELTEQKSRKNRKEVKKAIIAFFCLFPIFSTFLFCLFCSVYFFVLSVFVLLVPHFLLLSLYPVGHSSLD